MVTTVTRDAEQCS